MHLTKKKKGRKKTLDKDIQKDNKTKIATSSETIDTTTEYVKKLEDELLKLRIENAYLKELRRFRLKEESLLKEQRELSTVFEKNSN